MEQSPNKDEMFEIFAKESSQATAENFFSYMLEKYHYQPARSAEVCPALYEEVSDILEKNDYTNQLLHETIDKHMNALLQAQKRRGMIAVISGYN